MTLRTKNYVLTRKLIDNVNNNLSVIHKHQLNQLRKDNTKVLKIIAIVDSVYDSPSFCKMEAPRFIYGEEIL